MRLVDVSISDNCALIIIVCEMMGAETIVFPKAGYNHDSKGGFFRRGSFRVYFKLNSYLDTSN